MEKIIRKKFYLWQYEKEERWLNEMSAMGWQLKKASLFKYVFEQGQPHEYEYKLELLEKDVDSADNSGYLTFLAETGIERVGSCSSWVYLRKKSTEGGFRNENRTVSRLTHAFRIGEIYHKFHHFFVVLMVVSLVSIFVLNRYSSSNTGDFFEGFFTGMILSGSVIAALMIPVIKNNQARIKAFLQELVISERI